jgi:hypothetical protein
MYSRDMRNKVSPIHPLQPRYYGGTEFQIELPLCRKRRQGLELWLLKIPPQSGSAPILLFTPLSTESTWPYGGEGATLRSCCFYAVSEKKEILCHREECGTGIGGRSFVGSGIRFIVAVPEHLDCKR